MRTIRRIATILTTGVLLAACGGPGTDPGPAAPIAPSDVTVTQQDGYVTITWTHDGERVTGFRVTRSIAAAATSSVTRTDDEAVFDVGAQTRSLDDTGVQPGRAYAYQVTALGAGDASSPAAQPAAPVTVAPGFTLVAGTYAASFRTQPTSAFGMFFYLPADQSFDTQPTVTITGPPGWSGDAPRVIDPPIDEVRDGFAWTVAGFADAVVGSYTAQLEVDGVTYTASADLTSLDLVDTVSGLVLEVFERDRMRVAFDAHPTAVSYSATVFAGVGVDATQVGFATSKGSPIELPDLELEAGDHFFVVAAYPFDRTVPGRKVPPARFDVGVGISPIFVIEPVAITCDDPSDEPIADEALAAAIRDELGITTGPTCAQVASVEHINADGRGVRWLHGLEHAQALEDIQLDNNQISDIGPLTGLTALRWLWLGGNDITDASAIATLPDLRGLSLWSNPITTFAPLAGLTNLERLYINSTQATDFQQLAGLTALTHVHLYDAGISDLSFVAGMTQLEELMIGGGNDVADASVLANLTELRHLDLNYNQVADVSFLTSLPNLEVLYIGGNPLADTSPITALTGLERLNVERLGLDSLAFLAASPDLRELWAGGNDVNGVAVLNSLPNLRHVSLWENPIADPTPIYALTGLISLDIGGTGANDLSFLTASPDLESLWAWGNNVGDITVLQELGQLRRVNLDDNPLTSLAPLVANPGIGPSARIDILYNCLDLTPGSAGRAEIDQLLDRGVDIEYDPQRDDC